MAQQVTLRNGALMPLVGLGTWKIPKDIAAQTVYNAIKAGYRLLDCACDYGNEKEVGEGLKQAIQEGIVKREDVWITSKLWNTFHAKEHVRPACERTLRDLGVEYLDLYLIHFPIALKFVDFSKKYPPEWSNPDTNGCVFVDVPTSETWSGMEELVQAGLVKNIGVSNFNNQHIMDLMKYANIKPAALQVELHPYLQQPQLVEYCQRPSVNIAVTAYSSFGGVSYIPLGSPLAKETTNLLEHPTVLDIAKKHNKTTAQVLLRWAVQNGVAVIPKSNSLERLKENISVFDFKLDSDDIANLQKLNTAIRFNDPAAYVNYPIFG